MGFPKGTNSRRRKRKYRALIKSCNEDCEEVLKLMNSHVSSNNDVINKDEEESSIVTSELKRNERPPDFEQSADIVEQPVLLNNLQEKKLHNSDCQNEEIEILCKSDKNDEVEQLRSRAIEENVTLKSLDKLLNILCKNVLTELTRNAKSFLHTARASYTIKTMKDCSVLHTTGQFVYIGIEPVIVISGKKFDVKLKTFVADTPARSYLKCIKGHGGYHACERCIIPGKLSQVIYPGHNFTPRTYESYRSKNDFKHHIGTSPFESIKLKVSMVTIFVLDFMHLACCGEEKFWFKHAVEI